MPELNPQFAQFQKELETLLDELIKRIKQVGGTKTNLARIASEIDFFEELKSLGFEDLVDKYFSEYDKIIAKKIKEAKQQGVTGLVNVDIDSLEQIRDLETQHLIKSAQAKADLYKSELLKSIIRGDTIADTISNLEKFPLTDAQLGTVLNTQYSEFSRTATREVYKGEPDQRFQYTGGIIPTSSEECRWLMLNQKPEGYTMKEIDAGIETPFTHQYGELAGQVKKIYWQGREPNFNCIHQWEIV
jgi:hypothetical protein